MACAPGGSDCAWGIAGIIWTVVFIASFVETINYGVRWSHDVQNQAALSSTDCLALGYDVVNGTFERYDCAQVQSDSGYAVNCQWNLYFQINGSVQFNYTTAHRYSRIEWVQVVQWAWPIPWTGICPPGVCNTTSQVLTMFSADYPFRKVIPCWYYSDNPQGSLPVLSDFSAQLISDRYWCLFSLVAFLALIVLMVLGCLYAFCCGDECY